MIAEPLNHSAYLQDSGAPGYQEHGYGSLIRYGYGAVSYHHNLYADNYSRNPRPGDNIQLDFINNVVFNWGILAGYNEDDSAYNPGGYTNFFNCVGNYFIAGNNTTADPNIAFASGVPSAANTQIYEATNFIDNNPFGIALDGIDTGLGMFSGNYTPLGTRRRCLKSRSPRTVPRWLTSRCWTLPAHRWRAPRRRAPWRPPRPCCATPWTPTSSPASATRAARSLTSSARTVSRAFISITNFGVTYSGYSGAATYWTSQGLSQFVGVNPWPVLNSAPQPLDSDGDGMPDYWEITLVAIGVASMNPAVPNNNHSNPDGYTDLEHYLNWLAAPHALTVSNTPVDVDLYAVVGRTGNLNFGVTNGTNGTVTLGSDGHTATFMPTNNYFGFASFGFNVTNLDTDNQFWTGDGERHGQRDEHHHQFVLLTNAVPQTNTVPAGGIDYYLVWCPPMRNRHEHFDLPPADR